MTKKQMMLLWGCDSDSIRERGPIKPWSTPAIMITLDRPPAIQPNTGKIPLSTEVVRQLGRRLALCCECDTDNWKTVRSRLQIVATALHLVKPTVRFLELWIMLDSEGLTEMADRRFSNLASGLVPQPYLQYQQHNQITQSDVDRTKVFLPRLAEAMDTSSCGSWNHPLLPIHRALVFFCQGYSVRPRDPKQFLWAAGLDCLYASKRKNKKQGSGEIGRRMQKLLGPTRKLYEADTVTIPPNQEGRKHRELQEITSDIFKLRNAFAHGLPIPDINWLEPKLPRESGYAYQLIEQTEIALRLTLLKILEKEDLFKTFSDPQRLDEYFM
jgi:hypothetical protein